MSRGASSGGGKSSLDYLFESDRNLFLSKGSKEPTLPPFALDSDVKARDNETTATALEAPHSSSSKDQELKSGKVVRNLFYIIDCSHQSLD